MSKGTQVYSVRLSEASAETAERLMKVFSMNRSEVIRMALQRLEEDLEKKDSRQRVSPTR